VCQVCERREASHFCECAGSPFLLCLDCIGLHHAKHPRTIHQVMPIAALRQSPKDYRHKYEALKQGREALLKSLESLEQLTMEFDDLMQNCIRYMTEYRTWWLQTIQTEKAALAEAVETAIQETTACLDEGTEPENPIAQALWTLPAEDLQVVSYAISPPDLQTFCQTWVTYTNNLHCLYARFAPHQPEESNKEDQILKEQMSSSGEVFASMWENIVQIYDLKSQQSYKHILPAKSGNGRSYIALEGKRLLLVGDYPASKTVYELDLSSLLLTSLPSMGTARSRAGLATTTEFIYVFGGCGDSPLNSCEKYELHSKQWLPLGPMHQTRFGFTPCTFLALIYLTSPQTTCSIETFSPETETFSALPVSLPPQLIYSFSVSFVCDGELYVLSSKQQLSQWKIGSEGEFRCYAVSRQCRSSRPPLVVGSLVLIANNYYGYEGVQKLSLEAKDFL